MKGNFLVHLNNNQFFKDKRGYNHCYIGHLAWGDITLAPPFNFYTETIEIDTQAYIAGYAKLSKRVVLPSLVYAEIQNGPVAVNKSNIKNSTIIPDIDIYNNCLIFKNGATIGAYIATGLSNIFQPGDVIEVSYPIGSKLNLSMGAYLIDATTYSNGYIDTGVDINISLVRVVNGALLMDKIDYITLGTNIIFKNGISIGSYTSSGLSNVVQQNDVLVILVQSSF